VTSTIEERQAWFDAGVEQGAHYMIIVTDTFSYEDYPEYVTNGVGTSVSERSQELESDEKMSRVMEIFDLKGDKQAQFASERAWAVPRPAPSPSTLRVEKELAYLMKQAKA
jgi:hypothetical protein